MVKVKITKQLKGQNVGKYELECDRLAAVLVQKGNCSLTMSNISLTEALGAIDAALKDASREAIYQNGEGWSKEPLTDLNIVIDIEVKEEGQSKPNSKQVTAQRGVFMVKQKGQYEIIPLNIEYDDAIGCLDLTRMLQLINASITGAMSRAMSGPALGPSLPGVNIPGMGRARF